MRAAEDAPAHGDCQGPGTTTRRPFQPHGKFPRAPEHSLPSPGHLLVLRRGAQEQEQRLKHEDSTSLSMCCKVRTQKQES